MGASQYIITPWHEHSELLHLRDHIYNPKTSDEHSEAIRRIQAWKLRGNLPHAVESTGLLFDAARFHNDTKARIRATRAENSPVANNTFPIRATYTLALSRFVTGFADLGRHRSGAGQTMKDVARSIDLPATFVEIRHEATHEDIPTLSRLADMTTQALSWLWVTYWARLDDTFSDDTNADARTSPNGPELDIAFIDKTLNELRSQLKAFRSRRIAQIGEKKTRSKKSSNQDVAKAVDACASAVRNGNVDAQDLVRLLVCERLIIPSKVDKFSIEAQGNGARLIWSDFLLALSTELPQLPQLLLTATIEDLAQVETSSGAPDPRSVYVSWIVHFCTAPDWSEVAKATDAMTHTLTTCCIHPSPLGNTVASELLSSKDVAGTDIESRWRPLIEASRVQDSGLGSSEPDLEIISAADSVRQMEDLVKMYGRDLDNSSEGWTLASERWRAVPIGVEIN